MESNSNSIVPNLLNKDNYKTWSRCMKSFLLSQDLWDVIEEDNPESSKSTPDSSNNNVRICWRKKNASALHAIQMSCSPDYLLLVVEVESAKKAWNLLASQFSTVTDEESTHSEIHFENERRKIEEFVELATNLDRGSFIRSHFHATRVRVNPLFKSAMLINGMESKDFETKDANGYTPFAVVVLADQNDDDLSYLLSKMVDKNPNLTNIGLMGDETTLPVLTTAKKGLKKSTKFLLENTDTRFLNPNTSKVCTTLLRHCIESNFFDIAVCLVTEYPDVVKHIPNDDDVDTSPILSFARKFSTVRRQVMPKKLDGVAFPLALYEALYHEDMFDTVKLLDLVCENLPDTFNDLTLQKVAYAAMIEAARSGNIEFITAMVNANSHLYKARDKEGRTMFWQAVVNRDEEIFNLIYYSTYSVDRENVLSCCDEDGNNTLHYAAMLPPMLTLDRISTSPALQIQRELQWFKEVESLSSKDHIKSLNKDGLTPRELFDQSHKTLMQSGEKVMKETAQSCTTVGALIVTIMFAAVFTFPGGNDQNTGYPIFKRDTLFNIFIVCDALSLSSSSASIVIFLEILTSSYVNEDFVLHLPRKVMIGLLTLFISIATMMLTFCLAIAIMFHGRFEYIVPISLVASSPVLLFSSSIYSLGKQIYASTFGPSIFKKYNKLSEMKEFSRSRVEDDMHLSVQ